MTLATEVAGIGTWEFDLEQGAGFISERCSELMGRAKLSPNRLIQFEDWLSMIPGADRRLVDQPPVIRKEMAKLAAPAVNRYGWSPAPRAYSRRTVFSIRQFAGTKTVRKAVRMLGIMRDLSERPLYQRALAESDQRLRWSVEHAPIPIMIHSEDGQIIELNRSWQRISGYSIEEIPTLEAWAAVSWDRSLARAALAQIYGAGDGASGSPVELALRTKNGELRQWLFFSAELGNMDRGRDVRMISALDLTERKAAEEQRNNALARAEAASRSKDQFLGTLSHELRTPLNAILGWIFLMKQDSVKPEVEKEGLAVIERNARAQSKLIADLLDLSRIVAGKLRLEPRLINFLSCLESAIDNIRPAADEKGIRVVNKVDSSVILGIAMHGDPVRLEQVLVNVLVNAIKFTPPNGSIEVSLETSASLMRLTVADTGIGIAPEFLSSLFDRFSQADESLKKDRGLGLGLTISRHVVELHDGKIFVTSGGLGKGASFTIELPISSLQLATLPEKSSFLKYPEQGVPALDGITIVAVDDNADARAFVDQVLRLHGARVFSVETGAKAIEAVLQYHPDVVLCDLMMTEMDWYGLLRRLRTLDDEAARKVPVVAMTALAGAENRLKTQQAGFRVHLDKPIDPPRLIEAIQALIKPEKTQVDPG
jgi:PAS domain S-box-containing protein